MRPLKEFVQDAGGWGLVSVVAAALAFGIGWWDHAHDKPISAFVFVCLSIPLFWVGAFLAWHKKRSELEQERARNARPDIDGEILEAFIAVPKFWNESGNEIFHLDDSVVALNVITWNKVQMPPISPKNVQLELSVDGATYSGLPEPDLPVANPFLIQSPSLRLALRFHPRFNFREIEYLKKDWNYPLFYVKGLKCRTDLCANIKLVLVDLSGAVHTVKASKVHLDSSRLVLEH